MEFTPPFTVWMRKRRQVLDMTQAELARAVHYATITVRTIEEGRARPSPELIDHLATVFGVPEAQREEFRAFARGADVSHAFRSLPAVATSLLHREAELAELSALISDPAVRLVTLVGPPGVGKTHLAIEAARRLTTAFADGACFVPLVDVQSAAAVPGAIAAQLQVPLPAGQAPHDELGPKLHDRRLLLVLDNFEHVLAAAQMVGNLLAAAPGLTVLATSRSALALSAERTLAVQPLAAPAAGGWISPDDLAGYPSVALFVARAQAVKPDFQLNPANAAAVAELCRELEGLPLAIELAAGRMRMFTPQALLRHLRADAGGRMMWLASGPRDAQSHHRTLRDTLAWSYRLLMPAQQRLFRAMGVFRGGFTLAALVAVGDAGGPPRASSATSGDVDVMLTHNLIKCIESGDLEPRYLMLETIREFALEQLHDSGEEPAVRDRHARFYSAWSNALLERADLAAVTQMHGDMHNVSAAFTRSYNRPHLRVEAVQLAIAIIAAGTVHGFFWDQPDDGDDAYRCLAAASEDQSLPPDLRLRITDALSSWASDHDFTDAQQWAEQHLAMARAQGNKAVEVAALIRAATVALLAGGQADRAAALGREAVTTARALGDRWLEVVAISVVGWCLLTSGDYDGAIGAFEDMLEFWRGEGVIWQAGGGVARSLLHLGRAWQMKGERQRAAELLNESAERYRAVGDVHGVAWARVFLGFASFEDGDTAGARAHFQAALRDFPRAKDSWIGIAMALAGLSEVARQLGDPIEATALAGAAFGVSQLAHGYPPGMNERLELERILDQTQTRLDSPAVVEAWAAGQLLSADAAIQRALAAG
jgi:predicted ATPase/DNA-binding XRE family transcriptional regulator